MPRDEPLNSKPELGQYYCNDCNVDLVAAGEFYMLHPRIWTDQLGLGWSDNLCSGCLETRLGREVRFPIDMLFPPQPSTPHWSDRMHDRMGYEKDRKGKWRQKK